MAVKPRYCRKCGTHLPLESQFCPACGASQTAIDHIPTNRPSSQELAQAGTGRLPSGSLLRGRYRLLHTVGQGGMGAVYVGQDTQLGDRLVAVKEMSMSRVAPHELPQAIEQFKREAYLLATLHHQHLPVIYEYFGEGERWYVVMSFIEGGSLQAYLNATPEKKLPIDEVVRIGIALCDVLDFLHTHRPQIIFRDLKPSNIMYTPRKEVYLIDFGIARHFKQDQAGDTTHYYSAGYAPPEQYGQSQTGPRSDIYSLGATLHQMLSGRSPANNPFQFPALHVLDPRIHGSLAELIAQMLEMDEQRRPASAAEVKEQLTKVLQVEPAEATRSADEKRQESGNPVQGNTAESTQTRQNFWENINALFAKNRIFAWFLFIVLNLLIGVGTGSFVLSVDSPRGYNHAEWLYVAGVGAAVVGLFFLLAKGRFRIDMFGGIALALFGNLVLCAFLSPLIAFCGFTNTFDFDSGSSCFPTPLTIPALAPATLVLCLSILLLFVGTRFFLRSGSARGALIFGVGLILAGVVVTIIVKIAPLYTDSTLLLAIPAIGSMLWLPSASAGALAVVVALLQMSRKQPGTELI